MFRGLVTPRGVGNPFRERLLCLVTSFGLNGQKYRDELGDGGSKYSGRRIPQGKSGPAQVRGTKNGAGCKRKAKAESRRFSQNQC